MNRLLRLKMRLRTRLFPALLATLCTACQPTTAPKTPAALGTYELARINGSSLPAFEYDNAVGRHEVLTGVLTLRGLVAGQADSRQGFWALQTVETIRHTNTSTDTVSYADSGYFWSAQPSEDVMTFVDDAVPDFSFAAVVYGRSLRAVVGGLGALSSPSHVVFIRQP